MLQIVGKLKQEIERTVSEDPDFELCEHATAFLQAIFDHIGGPEKLDALLTYVSASLFLDRVYQNAHVIAGMAKVATIIGQEPLTYEEAAKDFIAGLKKHNAQCASVGELTADERSLMTQLDLESV